MPFKEKSSTRHKRVKRTVASVKSISNAHEFPSFDDKVDHLHEDDLERKRKKLKNKKSIPGWKKTTKGHKKARNIVASRIKKLRKDPRGRAVLKNSIKAVIKKSNYDKKMQDLLDYKPRY